MLKYSVLASGSSGNLTLVESPETKILIDCGISGKRVREKLNDKGLSLEDIDLVLITHKHVDHIRGLAQVSKVVRPCVSDKLYPYIPDKMANLHEPLLFAADTPLVMGDLEIIPVAVSHDCVDPVCFVVSCGSDKLAVVTDLGEVNVNLIEAVRGARVVIMEANYDLQMLSRSSRPVFLKNRILSKVGHLSNRSSGRFLAKVYTISLEEVVLVHLSQDCNTPELAIKTVKNEMSMHGIFFDRFQVAGPDGLLQLEQTLPVC
jgi:phosphoribosyl 1,2-cyclic phosphodiesterase